MSDAALRPLTAACTPGRGGAIHLVEGASLAWQPTAEPGLRLKAVRYDDERGHFLGLVQFAPMARSGLHQHTDVAISFVLEGGLTDYHGHLGLHQAGINLRGATHDAVAYQPTLLVARLQGPVLYPRERSELTGLHAGSRHAEIRNPAPDVPPEMNIPVDSLPAAQTGVPGITRQTVFDYAGTGHTHRFVQLAMRPGTQCPAWRAGGLTEGWVRGGLLEIDGRIAAANTFIVIEPGATVRCASPHGALWLAWAEAAESWLEPIAADAARAAQPSLFGF